MIDYFATCQDLNPNEEQQKFLEILYHDVRNGFTIKSFKNGQSMSQKAYKSLDLTKRLQQMASHTADSDVFVSINSFTCPKRNLKTLYNRTALILDLDVHGQSANITEQTIRNTMNRLNKAYNVGELCPPTMITFTGRGLALFYVLEHSIPDTANCQNAQKKATYLQNALFKKYEVILSDGQYCDVDHVVKDTTRIIRLPGTLNQKNGEFCRLMGLTYDAHKKPLYYDLYSLEKKCKLEAYQQTSKQMMITKEQPIKAAPYDLSFLDYRIQKLEKLIELRNGECEGTREILLFSICNASVQREGYENALNRIIYANRQFTNPLDEEEVQHVFDSVILSNNQFDQGGYYPLSNAWIMNAVHMTEEENQTLHFDGVSLRRAERNAKKVKSAAKREERNNYIISLATTTNFIYADIARIVAREYGKCSERLVKLTLKKAGIFRYNKSAKKCIESFDVVNEHSELPMLEQGSPLKLDSDESYVAKIQLFSKDFENHVLSLMENDFDKYKHQYNAMNYLNNFYNITFDSLNENQNEKLYHFQATKKNCFIKAKDVITIFHSLSQDELLELHQQISTYYANDYMESYIHRLLVIYLYERYKKYKRALKKQHLLELANTNFDQNNNTNFQISFA